MATISLQFVEPVQTAHGGPPFTRQFSMAAAQTFKRGTLVTLVNGLVTIATGVIPAAGHVLGVAAEDALDLAGVLKTSIGVWVANHSTVFIMNLEAATASAALDVGLIYGVNINATTPCTIDKSAGAVARGVKVIGLDPRDALLDTQARLHVVIESTTCMFP